MESRRRKERPLRRSLTVARHDALVLSKDFFPVVVLLLMPLVIMAFLKPSVRCVLTAQGYPNANGSESAVPGMTIMFAFFGVTTVAFSFLREHGWKVWGRVRASRATTMEILVGKLVPGFVLISAQQLVLLVLGGWLYDLRVQGAALALLPVVASLSLCLVSLGMVFASFCNTMQQVSSVIFVGSIVFSGLAGAFSPAALLPEWTRTIAVASPGYWAMQGLRTVVLDGGGVADILDDVAVLLVFALGFALIALWRFRVEEEKVGFA